MDLLPILKRYESSFLGQYGHRLSREQRYALQAMMDCRSGRYGELQWFCDDCERAQFTFQPCGHRSCPRCQHHDTSNWLARQQLKLLPVEYFMVTFTLPYELRALTRQQPKLVFNLMFDCAVSTLKEFALNDKDLGGEIGMTAVLHTHSRRLAFHPHIHLVIPGGCLLKLRKQWKKLSTGYLFNEFALAKVFRGKLLAAMIKARLSLPANLPSKWVADCKSVGRGMPALTYLARYLYRGVISENNIVDDDGANVTFRYTESRSGETRYRQETGEKFIWLLLQHVLPTGFRRARDYGILHGNARRSLRIIQLFLGVIVTISEFRKRPALKCDGCGQSMRQSMFISPAWSSG